MRCRVDEFDDGARSLMDLASQDNLRHGPFHHKIEAANDEIDAFAFLGSEELSPADNARGNIAPFHLDQVAPIHLAQGSHLNQCQLLG
jgi:hypothetical protein